jgi:hypothetical protein
VERRSHHQERRQPRPSLAASRPDSSTIVLAKIPKFVARPSRSFYQLGVLLIIGDSSLWTSPPSTASQSYHDASIVSDVCALGRCLTCGSGRLSHRIGGDTRCGVDYWIFFVVVSLICYYSCSSCYMRTSWENSIHGCRDIVLWTLYTFFLLLWCDLVAVLVIYSSVMESLLEIYMEVIYFSSFLSSFVVFVKCVFGMGK